MDYFAGLDVSVKETSVCIVDDTGKMVREVKVASEPKSLLAALKNPAYHFKRIGLEAGPLSQWLFSALAARGERLPDRAKAVSAPSISTSSRPGSEPGRTVTVSTISRIASLYSRLPSVILASMHFCRLATIAS